VGEELGWMASWGWLYGEQVKEFQMWVTSSLPSQHNKAVLLYIIFFKMQNRQNHSKIND